MKKKLFLIILAGFQVFLAQAQTPAGIRFDYRNTKPGEIMSSGKNSYFHGEKHKGLVLLMDTLNRSAAYYSVMDQKEGQYGFELFSRRLHYFRTESEELNEGVSAVSMIAPEFYESDSLVFENGVPSMGVTTVMSASDIKNEGFLKQFIPEIVKIDYFEDTKEIMGYRCQKAKVYTQRVDRLKTLKLVKYERTEYTLWFTEKLPNPFIEFAGLKGLALEYTDGEKTYTAIGRSVYTEGTDFKDLFSKVQIMLLSESDWTEREKRMSPDLKVRKEKFLTMGYEEIEE